MQGRARHYLLHRHSWVSAPYATMQLFVHLCNAYELTNGSRCSFLLAARVHQGVVRKELLKGPPDDRLLMLEPGWLGLKGGSAAAAELAAAPDVECKAGCGWLPGLGAGACKISAC